MDGILVEKERKGLWWSEIQYLRKGEEYKGSTMLVLMFVEAKSKETAENKMKKLLKAKRPGSKFYGFYRSSCQDKSGPYPVLISKMV